jgi:hypothetical protein
MAAQLFSPLVTLEIRPFRSLRGFERYGDFTTVTPPRLGTVVSSFSDEYHFCMDKSGVRVTVLGAWLVFGAFVQSSVAASSDCTIGQEERTVLTSVLKEIAEHSHSALVVESRTDSSDSARTFTLRDLLLRDETSELLPQLNAAPSGSTVLLSPAPIVPEVRQHELERDYNAKLSRPCSIPSLNSVSKLLVFRSPAQVRRTFSSNDLAKRWSQFHRVFGNDAELLTFSRVAFDSAKQYALVHVSSGVSEDGGGGELYLLTRLNGDWVIKRVFPTWTT